MSRTKVSPGLILAKQKLINKRNPYSAKRVQDAATALGRLGGLKGGVARANALNATQRYNIARHAANQRWGLPCLKSCKYC